MLQKVVPTTGSARLSDISGPKVAGDIDNVQFMIAKFEGDSTWHCHENTDELFFVLSGRLRVDFEDESIKLVPGEFVVIPHGVEHRPVGIPSASIVLLESASKLDTGTAADNPGSTEPSDRPDEQ